MVQKEWIAGGVTLALLVGGVGYLFLSSSSEAFEYYKHVDEVMQNPAPWQGKRMQLHGFVEPGSIKRRLDREHQQVEYKFRAVNCMAGVDVRYAGTVPDTFKDRAEVVVNGVLDGGEFRAQDISAKCPSKYQAAVDNPTVTLCVGKSGAAATADGGPR